MRQRAEQKSRMRTLKPREGSNIIVAKGSLALFIVGFLGLTGCGSPKNQSAESASNPNPVSIDDSRLIRPESGDGRVAECNEIVSTDLNIEGRVTTFYDPQSGRYIENYSRLSFSQLPDEVLTSDFHYVQIFTWSWTKSEGKTFADRPASILLMERNTGRVLSDELTVLSRNTLRTVISDNGLGFDGITVENFFDHFIIILKGMEIQYRGLWVGVFDSTASDKALGGVDSLLPPFDAHPQVYEQRVGIAQLAALHPFIEFKSAGWTSQQFARYALNMCMATEALL